MKKASGDGVHIQLAEWEGEGRPVFCVHGITANCRCWDVMADALSPTHRVLAMDLRGRGLSDKPDTGYSIAHHINDIRAVLDDLGLEKVAFMGHSLGAFISLVFGATFPERVDRIILVDGGGKLSEEQMAKVFAGIKPSLDRLGKVFPSFEEYIDMMKQAPFLHPWSEAFNTYYQYEVETVEEGVRPRSRPEHIQEEAQNLGKVDVSEFYGKIQAPTLILRATDGLLADDDILLPEPVAERMLQEIPDARLQTIEGVNHYMIVFQPNETRDQAILDFLAS
ncbi:MAG: alpha/beta hydrolase [Deltaproteobacteria bacterium]|nr:alpha/beta hydrolase [Deltaproteobacteria bacterium]